MSVTCEDIVDIADKCLSFNSEVGDRSAISRAYYASYHFVYPVLENGPTDSHQGLIDYLQGDAIRGGEKYNAMDLKAISFMLSNMKSKRKVADYYLDQNVKRIDAEVAVLTSKKLLEKVHQMISPDIAQK